MKKKDNLEKAVSHSNESHSTEKETNVGKPLRQLEDVRRNEPIFSRFFYAIFSLVLIGFMFLLIVTETIIKYEGVRRHFTVEMIKYFDRVGFVMIIYVLFCIAMFLYEYGLSGIPVYFSRNKHELLFVVFLIYSLVAAICSSDKDTAFFGAKYRDAGFITYLMYGAAYICGKQICYIRTIHSQAIGAANQKKPDFLEKEEKKIQKKGHIIKLCFYFMFLAVCTFQNSLLIADYFGYKGSELGAFYNTNHSAYFMVISIFAMIGYAAVVRHIVLKVLGYQMYAINLWCLIINDTFGAYLAVIAGLLIMVILYGVKYKKIGIDIIVSVVIFIGLSVAIDLDTKIISKNFGMLSSDTQNITKDTESDISKDAGSGRWNLWLKGFDFLKEHPLLGCGPDCMPIDEETGDLLMLPHNEFLQYAMEIGTPASLIYIIALILMFIIRCKTLKTTDDSSIYDCAAVTGYLASAFFGINIFYTAVYFFIFLGIAGAWYYSPEYR